MNRRDILKLGALVPMAIIGNTRRTGQSVSAEAPAVDSFPELHQIKNVLPHSLHTAFHGWLTGPYGELITYSIAWHEKSNSFRLEQSVDNLPRPWNGVVLTDYVYISREHLGKMARDSRTLNEYAMGQMAAMYADYTAWIEEKQPFADDKDWASFYADHIAQPSRSLT